MKVRDLMTSPPIRISPRETVSQAARTMEHYNIGALPVVEEGKLCGMLSLGDLATSWQDVSAAAALTEITSPVGFRE